MQAAFFAFAVLFAQSLHMHFYVHHGDRDQPQETSTHSAYLSVQDTDEPHHNEVGEVDIAQANLLKTPVFTPPIGVFLLLGLLLVTWRRSQPLLWPRRPTTRPPRRRQAAALPPLRAPPR